MKNNRKWALGIGLAAIIGVAFWIRALASWRPVTVGKVGFTLDEIRVSPDGNWLLVRNQQDRGAVVNLQNGDFGSTSDEVRAFDQKYGTETFPRVWMKEGDLQPSFSPAPQRDVLLSGISPTSGIYSFSDQTLALPTGWSKTRHEVYCAIRGVIWICDWTTGKLKKRVRYTKNINRNLIASSKSGMFLPDGKLLLAYEQQPNGNGFLRAYEVQTGKIAKTIHQTSDLGSYGFSPDGRLFWLTQDLGASSDFEVFRADNWRWLWTSDRSGPVKWLPDGRIGIMQKDSFEWRDASNRLLRQLPAPSNNSSHNVEDWALSPDGDWIYTCQEDGTIQRWRAR